LRTCAPKQLFGIPHPLEFEYRVLTVRHRTACWSLSGDSVLACAVQASLPQKTYDANPELGTES
jgi:hypothetical protein